MAHIAVERNRRRQMNEHLKVLRSLTPCFYIKRGDQASIIGGVIEFIKELHQVLQSLESNKRRRTSLSPSLSPNPSPRPRTTLQLMSNTSTTPPPPESPFTSFHSTANHHNKDQLLGGGFATNNKLELVASSGGASCNSSIADVEAKISGSNVLLKIIARRIHGQVVKIISVLERLSFEILHLNISSMEDTVLYSFDIKIGLECRLSLEELVVEVQQSLMIEVHDPQEI